MALGFVSKTGVRYEADIDPLLRGTRQAEAAVGRSSGRMDRDLRDLDSRWEKLGKSAGLTGRVVAAGFAAGGAAVGAFAVKAVKAASDLNEQINKNRVIFGAHAKGVIEWSKTTATSLGISQRAALEATGTFGNLLRPMGFLPAEAAKVSKGLVKMAADLASFNNADPTQVLEALRSGLVGETEPLRQFGIRLSDARVQAEALSLGLVKTTRDLDDVGAANTRVALAQSKYTEAVKAHGPSSEAAARASLSLKSAEDTLEKAMRGTRVELDAQTKARATLSLITKDAKLAEDDMAETSGSLANQQKILYAAFDDFTTQVGTALLPAVTQAMTAFSKFVKHLIETGQAEETARELLATLEDTFNTLRPPVENAAKALDLIADATGGWDQAFKLLLGGILVTKAHAAAKAIGLIGTAGSASNMTATVTGLGTVGTEADKAGRKVGALRRSLLGLGRLAPTVAITLLITAALNKDAIDRVGNQLDDLYAGFWKKLGMDDAWIVEQIEKGGGFFGKRPKQKSATGAAGAANAVFPGAGNRPGGAFMPPPPSSSRYGRHHNEGRTSGLEHWGPTAADFMEAKAHAKVLAPDDGRITRITPWRDDPDFRGMGCYFVTATHTWFFKHLEWVAPIGSYRKGAVIGRVASGTTGGDHLHVGHTAGVAPESHGMGTPTPASSGRARSDPATTPASRARAAQITPDRETVERAPAAQIRNAERAADLIEKRIPQAAAAARPALREAVAHIRRMLAGGKDGIVDPDELAKVEKLLGATWANLGRAIDARKITEAVGKTRNELKSLLGRGLISEDEYAAAQAALRRYATLYQRFMRDGVLGPAEKKALDEQAAVWASTIRKGREAAVEEARSLREVRAAAKTALRDGILDDEELEAIEREAGDLKGAIGKTISGAVDAVQDARQEFGQAWGRFVDYALREFDKSRGKLRDALEVTVSFDGIEFTFSASARTPSEVLLDQLESEREKAAADERRTRVLERVREAEEELAAAQADATEERAAKILAAEAKLTDARRDLAELEYQQRVAVLREQAAAEREAAQAQLAARQEAFDAESETLRAGFNTRLLQIGAAMADETLTYEQGLDAIRQLFGEYNVPFEQAGEALTTALSVGVMKAVDKLADAIGTLTELLEGLVRRGRASMESLEAYAARMRQVSADMAASGVDMSQVGTGSGNILGGGLQHGAETHGPMYALIGEAGREWVVPENKIPRGLRNTLIPLMRQIIARPPRGRGLGAVGAIPENVQPGLSRSALAVGGVFGPLRGGERLRTRDSSDDEGEVIGDGTGTGAPDVFSPTQAELFAAHRMRIFREYGGNLYTSRSAALGPARAGGGTRSASFPGRDVRDVYIDLNVSLPSMGDAHVAFHKAYFAARSAF